MLQSVKIVREQGGSTYEETGNNVRNPVISLGMDRTDYSSSVNRWKTYLFPDFSISGQMPPCVFHRLTGYFCPGCGGTRSVKALLSGRFLVCAVDYPMVFYAVAVYFWFMFSQSVDRISHHRIPIGMKYRHAWIYASLVIVIIHFILKNLFYMKTGIEPFL